MTTLEDQPNSVWNTVLDAYIKTRAVLEIRLIDMEGGNKYSIRFPEEDIAKIDNPDECDGRLYTAESERFEVRVEEKLKRYNVDALCGSLRRYNNGELTFTFVTLMEWDSNFMAWISYLEGDPKCRFLALCGNVLGFSADVLDVVEGNDKTFPFLYEWNRPDAPKTGKKHRKWLFKRK